ncbi:PREDICTED: MAP7 domain-containing protein 2 isoform X4 [Polistes canadensis]|uniref:MAP7 domain-containing protein 2 isoform X4 n=1 Tax=Polistes canadensis TaxID=91411 RepID=UPI000718E682|nr:PREDICTED: MAP7 domain-containing protein 2 isoform X4 [Polistes canadensis]
MFSELCRETLRKAAVCYSSGRTGSPSPSPPTSPPASPAKEAKIPANVDLGNVRGTGCEFTGSSGKRQTTTATTTTTQPVELRDFREKRPAMPTDFTKRLPGLEARDSGRRQLDECRFAGGGGGGGGGGSGGGAGGGGWGGGGGGGFGEIGEYGRPSSRLGRQSGLSSPESESEFDTSEDNSSTSGDEAGAASEEINQRTSSAHNRHSLTKDVKRRRSLYDEDSLDDDRLDENEARDSTGSAKDVDRARLVRERQNEERQRKLEELRQQALAAQRFREQREEERRKRIDELRSRDNDRRNQVEERKRLICEAERERREAILRKNQEREARIEAKKKNERSHIVFAFGSSTPRMLEPADTGGSTFWGTRRATSTTNVMMFSAAQPLTRRSSERELDGSKKRATSAGGLDRKPGEGEDSDGTPGTPSSVYLRVNRRRTDLMPTIPSPRDGPPTSGRSSSAKAFARSPELSTLTEQQSQPLSGSSMSRSMSHLAAAAAAAVTTTASGTKSLKRSDNSRSMGTLPGAVPIPRPTRAERLRRKARELQNQQQQGIRSGEVTPNSPSRPHSSMSQQSASSVGSSNVNLRPRTSAPRRPRPASIAGTGVSVTERHNLSGDAKLTKDSKPPLPKVHSTPKKPSTPKTSEVKKPTDKLTKNAKASPRITSKATPLQSPGIEHSPLIREATEIIEHEQHDDVKNGKSEERNEEKKDHGSEKAQDIEEAELVVNEVKNEIKNEVKNEIKNEGKNEGPIVEQPVPVAAIKQAKDDSNFMQETLSSQESSLKKNDNNKVEKVEKKLPIEQEAETETDNEEQIDMSASMIAKIRITTEEEAKAALAERRRLAREQAEREAELERLRLEEEARLEAEKLRAEEEEQRRLEEETLRLANEARQAEEQRLKLAIEEAKRREEEDRRRREEEARQKQEKEEAEKKAREEVERQRIEMAERLKKEEEERLARRKRVEAIMLRTRGKNQSNTPTKGEGGDGDKLKEDSPSDENKSVPGSKNEDVMTASLISEATQQFLSGEQRAHHVENVTAPAIVHNGTHSNGINENKIVLDNNQGNVEGGLNGHHTNNHGNEINSQTIALDNATVKQNNVTNNLLDLSEFDTLSNNSSGPTLELTLNMATEDTLNSNLNPAATPFTPLANTFTSAGANANINPFQDAYVNNKQQDSNQMSDLLS